MSEETTQVETPKRKLVINQDELTLGDMEDFEEVTGTTFSDAFKTVPVLDKNGRKIPDPDNKGRPLTEVQTSMRGLVGMIFLQLRKEDPSLTIEDVRGMKFSEFEVEVTAPDDEGEGDAATDAAT